MVREEGATLSPMRRRCADLLACWMHVGLNAGGHAPVCLHIYGPHVSSYASKISLSRQYLGNLGCVTHHRAHNVQAS